MSVKTKDAVFSSDNRIYLTKEQTQMTKGMAILSMLVLHLFCRKGGDVFGTPIFWLNTDTPFVYILGFLAEICVPLYSMCSGYAHFMLGNAGRLTLQANIRRIIRFLLNYWIIVIVFSIVRPYRRNELFRGASEPIRECLQYRLKYLQTGSAFE